jgi:ketosteroid isomerase-like protein
MTTSQQTAVEVARHFMEALNARDFESLISVTAEDARFPTPEGKVLEGREGVEGIMRAAEDARILLVRAGREGLDEDGDLTRVTVPVKEVVGKSEVRGNASFDVRDGKIASFRVETEMVRS